MSQVLPKPIPLTDPLDIIVQGCRENDMHCQEQLYRLCYPEMIKICCRYGSDMDSAGIIFNNAMLRVFRHIGTYQAEGKLMGWIKTIVVNCAIDFIKQQSRFKEQVTGDTQDFEMDIPPDVYHLVSAKEIQQVIRELPRATAAVLNLYIYEGFTHRQIAESLGISDGTSKWHLNEGRRLLKTKLENVITRETKNATR